MGVSLLLGLRGSRFEQSQGMSPTLLGADSLMKEMEMNLVMTQINVKVNTDR